MTTSFINSGNLILGANRAAAPSTIGTVVTERTELFIDAVKVESVSGVSVTVNKPTKSGSNPLFEPSGANTATWDYDKNYVAVQLDGSTWKAWYVSYADDGAGPFSCYATSSDGITWSKPNLGVITYDGDTNNNIFFDATGTPKSIVAGVLLNPDGAADEQYIMGGLYQTGGNDGIGVWKSTAGTGTWTRVADKRRGDAVAAEGSGLVELANGRWRVYYQRNSPSNNRSISFMESDSSTLTGAWSDNGGMVIENNGTNDQRYHFGIQLYHGNYLGWAGSFSQSTDQMELDMFFSRDGFSWTKVSDAWIPRGSATEFDDEMVLMGHSGLTKTGTDWYYFYTGFPADHAAALPRDARIGLATIGHERIGSIGTTGNLVTDPIMPAVDLHVNADASGGTLKVELLNANDDSILDGFSQDDFDTISSDTFDTTAQWGGIGIPINKEVKLKFYLSSATLYSYWVRS
jgi:hypothetical protein